MREKQKSSRHRRRRRSRRTRRRMLKGGAQSSPLRIGVIGQFKNEAMGIREWVEHYKWQGIDKVCLINDHSTDNFKEKLQGLESFFDLFEGQQHAQKDNYNQIGLPWCKSNKIDVVIITDLDEFWFAKDGTPLRNHIELLFKDKPAAGPSGYCARWHIFGSGGNDKQPASVREGFTMKWNELGLEINCKTFSWVEDVIELDLHRPKVKGEILACPDSIQLNHYMIQSKEYFEKVKLVRGAADSKSSNSVRDWAYFKKMDRNEVEDTRLRDLVQQARKEGKI